MSKECMNCKEILPDNAQFCSRCGNKTFTSFAVEYSENSNPQNPPANTYVQPSEPQGFVPPVQPPYTPPVQPVQPQFTPPEPQKKKNKKPAGKKKALIPVIAVILVVAIVSSIAAIAVSAVKNSPLVKIGTGITNLLTSGETYAVNGTLAYSDGNYEYDFNGKFSINRADQIASFSGEITYDDEELSGLGYISTADELMILEGKDSMDIIWVNDIQKDSSWYYKYDDEFDIIMDCAPIVFTALDYLSNPTDDKLNSVLTDAATLLEEYSDGEIDIDVNSGNDTFKQIYDILSDDIKDTLLDKAWLAENLGFEQTSNGGIKYHSYDFNVADAAVALLKIVKNNKEELMPIAVELFKDYIDSDMSTSEIEEEIEETLDYLIEEAKDELDFLDFTLSIGYKGTDIKSIEFKLLDDDNEGIKFNATIEKTNEDVGIDTEAYRKRYDELAKEYEEYQANRDYDYYY